MSAAALSFEIRPARDADLPALEALLAPEIEAGTVLPVALRSDDFLVAEAGGRLAGAVALRPLAAGTVELGSLVAAERGLGLGTALVEAAMALASDAGADSVVALTSSPDFFMKAGFVAASDRPWIRARRALGIAGPSSLPSPPGVSAASEAKSRTCLACPRLETCTQAFLVRPTARALSVTA